MEHLNIVSEPLDFEIYTQSLTNIRRLRRRLPEDLVANLAREVLVRVASRGDMFAPEPHDPTQAELEQLCAALVSEDDSAAAAIVRDLRSDGARAEVIYLKYLAAAARELGDWWLDDRASFVEVTVGTGRVLAIMRGMRHLFAPKVNPQRMSLTFASVPGEQHTLGVRMAADLFRNEGWDIALKVGLSHDELVADIQDTPGNIIGLSISGQHSIEPLSRLVAALNVCCPQAMIVVCGQGIDEIRPVLALMGLDAVAGDINEAKVKVSALWDREIARYG